MLIGTKVKMINCIEAITYEDRIWTTRSTPWQIGSGEWLVLLDGKAGGFDVGCLELNETRRTNMPGYMRLEPRFYAKNILGDFCGMFEIGDEITVYLLNDELEIGEIAAIKEDHIVLDLCDWNKQIVIKYSEIESVEAG